MNTHSNAIRPIFIVGSPRSGTTLLRFMVASHKNIHIPEETGFIPHIVKQSEIEKLYSQTEVATILKQIGDLNYLWRDLVPDVSSFYQQLHEPNITNILDSLYRQVIFDSKAIRWGDKTPLYVRHIKLIAKIFPQAQFIHVIRDGRDATLSAQQKWGLSKFFYMDNYYLLKNWVTNVTYGRKQGAFLSPNRYYEIKYESLVEEPEKSLHLICEFLHETFDPDMLSHHKLAQKAGPGPDFHTEVFQPVSTTSIGRWINQMSGFDKKMADRIAGPLLSELGYNTSGMSNFSIQELLLFSLLALKYSAAESFRMLFYKIGLLTINRNMRRIQ